MFSPAVLFAAPEVNPVTRKARSIPVFNVINMYGRVFFFSWFGFFVAFWSWYAFPPLIHDTIGKDLKLTKIDVANSNIVALCATLMVRLIAGPCCDRFGPRWTFAGTLIVGAIPTFLAGTCYTKAQLFACRFFVGILGGSFVPCQVWSTGFFDKNVVGTSNSLIAGWGNAGGGVTYFLMPAIYDSLKKHGLPTHEAWSVAFVVPGIIILVVASGLFFLCDDTPTGKWADRHLAAEQNLTAHGVSATIVDAPTGVIGDKKISNESGSATPEDPEKLQYGATGETKPAAYADHEAHLSEQQMLDTARGEIVVKPTPMTIIKVMFRPQVLVCAFCYFFSFGTELAVNSILATYYEKNFKKLNQSTAGQWAAMFGLLNIVTRPLGGMISDLLYRKTKSVWVKKFWMHFLGVVAGVFLIAIGVLDPKHKSTMFGLVAGMAFFLEGANGAIFSLVPHVSPEANGIVSGMTGGIGNLGGIVGSIIFRFEKTKYNRSFLIIGAIGIGINVLVSVIPPISKKQIGGR